ncbi:hypothetical protein [Arthrobacter sp. N1]|uniref:hypothetical protein n=1 Tax=Arthrobacter sp. N1 TaxID=619291 RepID=UPI003BAE64C2
MVDQDLVDAMVKRWKSQLGSDDYNEDDSDALLDAIRTLSEEAFEQIKADFGFDEYLRKRYP